MKTIIKNLVLIFSLLSLLQCGRNENENATIDSQNRKTGINLPQITNNEKNNLVYMYEEEKLARDTYTYLYQKWQILEFNSIQKSEQSHMNAVENILIKYNISYPKLDIGQFQNQELQNLYNLLISKGNISNIEALKVGATIEDVDIYDLQNQSSVTTNTLILKVYSNLMCGSRNHLRAFSKALKLQDTVYTPQYISLEEYNSIVSNPNENCGN